jgi:hypothetical protein
VGGPFHSVDHALDAIDRYLVQHKDENVYSNYLLCIFFDKERFIT